MEDSRLDPIPEEVEAISNDDHPPVPAIDAIVNEPDPVRVEGGGMYFDEDVNYGQFQLSYFGYANDDDPECFDPMVRAMLTVDGEPSDIDEARTFDDWEDWLKAHQKEWHDLEERKAFRWNFPPPNAEIQIIDSREVFKKKLCKDGGLSKYRVRVVAKGFMQTENVSFAETFSPTAQPVMCNGWDLDTADVSTAYLNAQMDKPVWMRLLRGFKDPLDQGRIMCVSHSLYGLKVSAKNWHQTFTLKVKAFVDHLDGVTMEIVTSDECIFKFEHGGDVLVILIVVDDILSATNNQGFRQEFLAFLLQCFIVTDDGKLTFFIGV
eukprot:321209-Rhodomonas_salina.1